MVTIANNNKSRHTSFIIWQWLGRLILLVAVSVIFLLIVSFPEFDNDNLNNSIPALGPDAVSTKNKDTTENEKDRKQKATMEPEYVCPYTKLSDLTPAERYPKASATRHIVDPPADDNTTTINNNKVSLVCCHTSVGPWSILVHPSWAPLGARRFLEMVRAQHFSSPKVPLMRCLDNFLCQFGLNGESSRRFASSLKDDPQWLPAGPTHRKNALNVKRFSKGYFSYAGGGVHSRTQQLFVTLADNGMLGGGSPWEVPWGELVGTHSFETLDKIYTGYGEEGPSQQMLHGDTAIEQTERDFPKLSWILGCQVVEEE